MEKLIYSIEINEKAEFIDRPNRFIAHCKLKSGEIVVVHVHDSGRIKELLYPGNTVYLRRARDMSKRKTEWDLISALSGDGEEILLNSSIHRYITDNLFRDFSISPFGEVDSIKAEVKYGDSRLDYLLVKDGVKIYIETKGVSLSENKIATFPDAPSIRASKHLNELIEIRKENHRSAVLLMVYRDSDYFIPKGDTDPKFYETFYKCIKEGVEVYLVQFKMKEGNIYYTDKKIEILENNLSSK